MEEERNVPINHGIHRATVLYGLGETAHHEALVRRYHQVRQFTGRLCQHLMTEDYVIQAMPDVSPPKWHLAHTSWFFETFILAWPLRAIDRRMPPMRISSIPITWRLVSGIAAPNGGYSHVQPLKRSIAIEPMWTSI